MPWVMCGVPRGTQEYLSPLCARAQGPAPAPGENLALWPCLIVLPRAAQSHPPCYPVPLSRATPLPFWACLTSPSLISKGPATSGIAQTPFSLGSGQRDLGTALTLMQRPDEPPIPSSRDSPSNLFITSNFVSPTAAKH